MQLFFRKEGTFGTPIVILHGIFGSSDNWLGIGKILAQNHVVYMVDQRNHGQSPHDDAFDYEVMANDLKELIDAEKIEKPILIGHSMGGKTVMQFSMMYPEFFSKMIVVDIAPKFYPVHHHMILQGLASIDLPTLKSRTEANEILKKFEENEGVRQFLLKNLWRNPAIDSAFDFRINLRVITQKIDLVGHELMYEKPVNQPVLFIRGENSNYILPEDERKIGELYPNYEIQTISNAGHWVQAEQPVSFVEMASLFIENQ